jgi:hypothetical protein
MSSASRLVPIVLFVWLLGACAPAAPTSPATASTTPARPAVADGEEEEVLPPGSVVALVPLATAASFDPHATIADYDRRMGVSAPRTAPAAPAQGDPDKQVSVFDVRRGNVMVLQSSAPIPWGALEGAAKYAWAWRDAATVLRSHQAYLVVILMPSGAPEPLADHLALTEVLASLMATTPAALGVFWGDAAGLASRAQVIAAAGSDATDADRALLWIGFWPVRLDDGRYGMATHGLAAFGQKELVVASPNLDHTGIVLRGIIDTAVYALRNGPVLKDGDFVDRDAQTHWPVKLAPSPWGARDQVLVIAVP